MTSTSSPTSKRKPELWRVSDGAGVPVPSKVIFVVFALRGWLAVDAVVPNAVAVEEAASAPMKVRLRMMWVLGEWVGERIA
ncbi:MAG: hypothetical protein ACT4P6_00320 [Gemmatimonadaceae bacterium]